MGIERAAKRKKSKEKPQSIEAKLPEKNSKPVFSKIHYAIAAAALATIGYFAYRGNKGDIANTDASITDPADSSPTALHKPENNPISEVPKVPKELPQFEVSEQKIPFEIPAGINISPEKFDRISSQLGRDVEDLTRKLAPKLAASQEPHIVIEHFLSEVIGAAKHYPELAGYVGKNMSPPYDEKNFDSVATALEKLFPRGGNIFRAFLARSGFGLPPRFIVDFYKIKKPLAVNALYHGSENRLPLYVVEEVFSNDDEGDYGIYLNELDIGIVHDEKIAKEDKSMFSIFQQKGWVDSSTRVDDILPGMVAAHMKASMFHEATHIFIGKTFKNGKVVTADKKFKISLNIPIRGFAAQKLDGEYYPVQFQELAATGIELIHADPKWPMVLTSHMNQKESDLQETDSNYLVKRILPFVTIDSLPDSPERSRIISAMQTRGSVNSEAIYEAVFKYWSLELAAKIGGKMAAIGFRFFQEQK